MAQDQQVTGTKRRRNIGSSLVDTSTSPVDLPKDNDYTAFLVQGCAELRRSDQYCDVTLKAGDTVVKSHRLILASNSEYFAARFKDHFETEGNVMELSTEYVDEQSFSKLVDMMYGKPFAVEDDLVLLFTTSLYLKCTYFIDRCKAYIEDKLNQIDTVELINTLEIQMDESLYKLVKRQVCEDFIALRYRLASVSYKILKDLLTDPDLLVTKEEQLLDFGKAWLMHDLPNRMKHLRPLASLLKPGHIFLPETLKYADYVENLDAASETDVAMALNGVLGYSLVPKSSDSGPIELFSTPLFLLKAHPFTSMVFGTYGRQGWEYWNEANQFLPPIDCELLKCQEGAVAGNTLYFLGCRDKSFLDYPRDENKTGSNRYFYGLDGHSREWINLFPPRQMASCLASCNSKVYAYHHSSASDFDGYQLSVFESVMNRWFRVPALNYPRADAGIACSDHILYVVGGYPMLSNITSDRVKEHIFEFYDCRRGCWTVMNTPQLSNNSYQVRRSRKCVCFINNTLYFRTEKDLLGLDVRNNRVRKIDAAADVLRAAFLLPFNETVWSVGYDKEIRVVPLSKDVQPFHILNPNQKLEHISMPYR